MEHFTTADGDTLYIPHVPPKLRPFMAAVTRLLRYDDVFPDARSFVHHVAHAFRRNESAEKCAKHWVVWSV